MGKISELQKKLNQLDKEFFPHNTTELMALGVAEEAGELSHAVLKRAQGLGDKQKRCEQIKDAIADIMVFCAQIASFEGFDLEENFISVCETDILKRTRKSREEHYTQGDNTK